MANYNIGQLRRSEITNYTSDIAYTKGLIVNQDSTVDFYDPYLALSGSNVVTSLNAYYLKFSVSQMAESVQNFSVVLKNREADSSESEVIKEFSVKQGVSSTVFEFIFHPNGSYNEVVFQLSRLALDFSQDNGDGTSGRIMDIEIEQFSLIKNVIDTLSAKYDGLETLTKIGIQGPPGLMFTIDGEEMRLGRRGIYELYNEEDISISYIGFIIKDSLFTQDGKDFFIMDFKY